MTVGGGVWCCGHCRERRGLFVEGVGHGCGGGGGDGGWPWGVVIRGGGGAPFCSDVCCECLMLAACRRECVCVCVCIRVCVCVCVCECIYVCVSAHSSCLVGHYKENTQWCGIAGEGTKRRGARV